MVSPLEDMKRTMESFGKVSNSKRCRLGYHFMISFKKNDGTSKEQALKIVEEFCRKYLKDFEAVYSVHTDKEHMHCHICFNATSYITGKKYRYADGDWAEKVQPWLDGICWTHGCHTLQEDTGISTEEYEKDRKQRKRRQAHGGSHSNTNYEHTDRKSVV